MTPTRPMIRYFGGKWRLAPWIIAHLPPHKVYVEPFGGAGSVLLRKPRAYAEVYNDADGEVVNLFRVARDDGSALLHALELTPYARDEYDAAHALASEPLERARRTVIRAYMGFGADSVRLDAYKSGFRSNSNRSGSTPAHDWATYPDAFASIVGRLRGVVIENRDAREVMRQHDSPDALHYVDPPYLHETRTRPGVHGYSHEMDEGQHAALLVFLRDELRGMVVLSGYRNDLYDGILRDWHRADVDAHADGARPRVESLWLSPRTWRAAQESAPDPLGLKT